jgi:FkbM family methyltransferase
MTRLKQALKRTFVYGLLKSSRARKQLARWTAHDQEMLEFYRGFVAPGDVCFDVGANIGNRVKILLELGARVVAVEPQRECARILQRAFGHDPRFTLVPKALGAVEGHSQMMICDADTLSSLSKHWVEAVTESGRFAERSWDRTEAVELTTLDRLVEEYGAPVFVKIDVEGFEYEVVQGLSHPVKALSLEFTPELIESTFQCLEHLDRIGEIRANYSIGESMRMAQVEWVDRQKMVEILAAFETDHQIFGDVYVRFAELQ